MPQRNSLCFEAFGEVINIWISPPPSYFGFVTFDSVESVNKTLASAPILLFGCHKLNVERKMPEHVSKGKRRGNNQPSSSGSDVQTPPSQDAASKEDLGPEDGSATAEIYWSDNEVEKEDVNLTEDDSWSQGESTDLSRSQEDLTDLSRSGEDLTHQSRSQVDLTESDDDPSSNSSTVGTGEASVG